MTQAMTEFRFQALLEAYGAEPRRWPEAERDAALAFAAAHPDIAEPALAAERALDALLGPAEAEPSDLLQARLMAALPARRPIGVAGTGWPGWRAPAAAAAALVVGVMLGFASGALTAPPVEDDYVAYAFTGFEEDWIDWLEDGEA